MVYGTDRGWGKDSGVPEALRVPSDGAADGLVIILLRLLRDVGLDAVVGLESGAMAKLLSEETFMEAMVLLA
jgi:hypothetical protein